MNITFDEVGHTYTDQNGNIIPSVTQILGQVYGTGLEDAPSYFVERAANKGTVIHKEIADYIFTHVQGESQEFKTWFKWFATGHFREWGCERVIYASTPYGMFAGTLDFYANHFIYDWKTCKTATKQQIKKWQMQLSFYCYGARKMGNIVNEPLKIVHITGDKLEVIHVDYLGDKFVEETMKLYQAGEKPQEVKYELQSVSEKDLATMEGALLQIEELEQVVAGIREKIKDEMERRGILNLQIGKVKMTYVAGTIQQKFDVKKFKEDDPDLYAIYLKDSEVKPYIRITTK